MQNIPNTKQNPKPFYKNSRFYLILLLILGIGLTLLFGIRAFRVFQHVRGHKFGGGETNVELIRGWMTVDYITKLYHVPPEVVLEPLKLPVDENGKRSIGSLISASGTDDPEALLEKIKENINNFQQKDLIPIPPPPPGDHP